jgi:zinc transport system substrate-binding protein
MISEKRLPADGVVKTGIVCTLSFVLILLLFASVEAGTGKVRVVASIFPVYDFVRVVGGERVALTQLLPPGVEAHGFAPTPRDIVRINQADLFVYTGEVMEPRVAKMIRSFDGDVQVVDVSDEQVPMVMEHRGHHDHHGGDPHFWLDPIKAKIMVEEITRALIQIDPDHQAGYQLRSKNYLEQLTALDAKIRAGLKDCKQHTIISGGHFAFGHFVKRYHLQAISAYPGFSPDGKPSPRSIATLIKTMEETGASAVFHEELMEPKVAKIIVEETGAELLLLHGVHNVSKQERADHASYLSLMTGNLTRLRQGLQCR